MNKVDIQQVGGFPLETDTLDYMQKAYTALQKIAALGGDNYILSGCTQTASNVTDGFVVIGGQVLPFRGGLTQTSVVIREDRETRSFENGQVKDVFISPYASFGTGTEAIPFESLSRLKSLTEFKDLPTKANSALDLDAIDTLATAKAVKLLNDKLNSNFPTGAIVIWSGAIQAIPTGWALCNGDNGTPNLIDRFVYGAGGYRAVGPGYDGEERHRLLISEMPSHRHNVPFQGTKEDIHGGGNQTGYETYDKTNFNTDAAGGDQSHNNMPPYYVLAYIMKL